MCLGTVIFLVGTATDFRLKTKPFKSSVYVPSKIRVYSSILTRPEKKDSLTVPATTIRTAANATARREIASQKEQFQQFGIMADWSDDSTYRTLGTYVSMSICESRVTDNVRCHRPWL